MGTLTSNGQTDPFIVGGSLHLHVSGTFGGGTFKVQKQKGDGSWVDLAGVFFTAADDVRVDLPGGAVVRGDLSGATSPNLYYEFNDLS